MTDFARESNPEGREFDEASQRPSAVSNGLRVAGAAVWKRELTPRG
jgi:hypothetical protein